MEYLPGMFQFHNGSIKRDALWDYVTDLDLFQFHNGSIKSTMPRCQAERAARVSIPQWFD